MTEIHLFWQKKILKKFFEKFFEEIKYILIYKYHCTGRNNLELDTSYKISTIKRFPKIIFVEIFYNFNII